MKKLILIPTIIVALAFVTHTFLTTELDVVVERAENCIPSLRYDIKGFESDKKGIKVALNTVELNTCKSKSTMLEVSKKIAVSFVDSMKERIFN